MRNSATAMNQSATAEGLNAHRPSPLAEVALGYEDEPFASNLQHNRARCLRVECDLMRRYSG